MHLPNQWSPALPKRINWLEFRQLACALSLSLIVFAFAFAGCAGETSDTSGIANLFGGASATPTATVTSTPTPVAVATPVAAETTGHPTKRNARQARSASENAAAASKAAATAAAAAAQASKQAATASKQAASVANSIDGKGPTNADVSLENGAAPVGATPAAAVILATPLASPSAPTSDNANAATVARTTPTLSSSALESSEPPGEGNPTRAAKLIQDVDKVETRIDRKNLDADDSQRDILAQRLLQEAKKSLAEHDSVAAISLATKASTLLEPLPKLADSSIPSAP
jgi:hypothetical protein